MTFTIRDILLCTTIAAIGLGWYLDNKAMTGAVSILAEKVVATEKRESYLQEKLDVLNHHYTNIVNYLIKFDAYRQYISAVAGNYVKEYADVRGMGDLEMEAVAHPDSSRWWYRSIAQKVIGGTVPVNPHCGDESYNYITKTFSVQ